jgi:phenylacetate-CoA ligase
MDAPIKLCQLSMLLRIVSHYLSDLDRLKKYDLEKIKRHRDNSFLKLLKYANSVPLYQKKFKDSNININNIRGFENIENFPIISRDDINAHYPSGIIASGLEKNSILVSTSGSTRSPVSLYLDQFTLLKALTLYARELKNYGLNWRKSRISLIANFYSETAPTQYFVSGSSPAFKSFSFAFSTNNIQQVNCDDELLNIVKDVDSFKPECIMGFPGPIRHLALMREKGLGQNINPKVIISSGGVLDSYEKKHISEVFNCKVFDIYSANEVGPVSFECEEGNYHIHSDVVNVEAIDKKGNLKDKGKEGLLAITRTYGRGTPLIRYTGMGDIISLKEGQCSCGLNTELMNAVHGRVKESIVLPSDKLVYPRDLMDIPGHVMRELKTNKIHQLQVIQKSINKIEVLIIIDEENRNVGPTLEKFFEELKKKYKTTFGPDVDVIIKEVKEFRSEKDRPDSKPGVLSKIDAWDYI